MFLLLRSLAVLVALATADSPRPPIEFTEDTLDVVKENVAKDKALLVDVRSVDEWNQGHLEGATFVPVTSLQKRNLDPDKLAKTLPPKSDKKILYTFCVVGMRAKQAAIILEQQGYIVRALKPGYDDLVKVGFKKAQPKDEDSRERDAK
jgi:rhodanese-related sulfurtransferase